MSGKIRIVHCIGTMRLGGAEKQLAELIDRLPRDKFEQSLVLLQSGGMLVDRIERAGCPVISLGYDRKFSRGDPLSAWAMMRALWRFIVYLRKQRPQILHAQLYWANLLGVVAGKLAGVPAIVVSHRQLGSLKGKSRILQWLENFSNRRATGIIVNSEAVRRDVLSRGIVNDAKITRIYNGVVEANFKDLNTEELRTELKISPANLILVMVANLHRYKGHDDLLRAAASLRDRHPALSVLLPGRDQGAGEKIRGMIQELNLGDCVQLLGERKDIPAILELADIVAHPSHEEGFSNSILEAMAAGKPLVVSDIGGNPEAVKNGENGFVVPAKNSEALTAALGKLMDDKELRNQMGRASRRRIEEKFSINRTVQDYISYYEAMAVAK